MIALATAGLLLARKSRYLPTVVGTIVGVHFFWLAPVFQDPWLHLLAAVTTFGAIAPLFFVKRWPISLVTLTCVGVAVPLFAFAVRGLVLALV